MVRGKLILQAFHSATHHTRPHGGPSGTAPLSLHRVFTRNSPCFELLAACRKSATWPLPYTDRTHKDGRASCLLSNTIIASPGRRAHPSREMQMKPAYLAPTPAWPPTLESYDYLSGLSHGTGPGKASGAPRATRPRPGPPMLPQPTSPNTWRVERLSRGCRRPPLLRMRGRSAPFADPSLTALQARHVWLPDACTSTLLGVT